MEILEEIENQTHDDPREAYVLDSLEEAIEAEMRPVDIAESDIVVDIESEMQQPWDALKSSVERGTAYNPIDALQEEFAVNMMAPSDILGVPVGDAIKSTGEFFDINPKELFKEATGRDWVDETSLRYKVQTGEITDRQRQDMVREQSTFGENLDTEWNQMVEAFSYLFAAAPDAAATVGTHLAEGDTEALSKDWSAAKDFTMMAVDEVAASLHGLGARPFSSFRQRPIDTASWIPLSITVKAPLSALKAGQVMKAAAKGQSISPKIITEGIKAGKSYYKSTSTADALKDGAKSALDAVPLPNFVKRGWIDLYAGTPEPFKELRKMYMRQRTADKLIMEEKILQPMQKVMKDLDNPYEAAKLWYALVGNVESVPLRKQLVEVIRQGKRKSISPELRGNLRQQFKMLRNQIDSIDPGHIVWTYDGIPMHTSQFIFDTQIGKGGWDASKIRYRIQPGAPKAVKEYAKQLLAVKRHVFELGADQANIRTSRLVNVEPDNYGKLPDPKKGETLNNAFLAEDMFRATVPNYLPIAKMPTKDNTLKEWFVLDRAARERGTIGMAGAQAKRTFDPKTKKVTRDRYGEGGPKPDAEYLAPEDADHLVKQHFVDSLELSLPKFHDTVSRYKLYDDLEGIGSKMDDNVIYKHEPTKGYTLAAGKTQMKRDRLYGGDIERYGALEGLYVQDDIMKVIQSGERHIRETDHALDGLMRTHRRLLAMVKHNKLIGNFSTQVHNILGIMQLMVAEGGNPVRFFREYKNFRKGLNDPYYRALAESGFLPTAARGIGDVSDTMKAIKNVKSSRQFAKIMFDDFSKNIPSNGVIRSAISTGTKGTPELAMQLMETTSYKLFGLNGRMAKFFTATDRIARYGFFKSELSKLAKKNKLTMDEALFGRKDLVEEAAKFSSDVMLDYNDLPTGIQFMRESGINPYIAYPWRASLYFMRFPFKKTKTYQGMEGFRSAVEGQDTQGERLRRRSQFPGDIMYPMGDEARDIMNTGMEAIGQPQYEELNVSPRYWSPVPIAPEEMYGLRPTSYSGDELLGSSGLTALDDRSAIAQTTGVPLPDPMGWKPAIEAVRGEPLKAAAAFAPGYASKITRDKLYGKEIPKRDLYLQSFLGLRTLPQTHRRHAFDVGNKPITKLKGQPRFRDLPTGEKMQRESEVLTRSTRGTLF